MSPPMTTRARGRWISAPIPCESAAGRKPITAPTAATTIGRNRISHPRAIASRARAALLHRSGHQASDVAVPHAPLGSQSADVALAQDLGDAVHLDDRRKLRDRDALAAGGADGEVPGTGDRVAVLDQPHRDVEAPLALVELGHDPALGRGFDHVLDVLDVDAESGRRGAVHDDL